MAWNKIEHKKTHEVTIVASTEGYDLADYKVTKLKANRAPGEFHIVGNDGSVETDLKAKERSDRLASLRSLSHDQLLEVIADMQAEIEQLKGKL